MPPSELGTLCRTFSPGDRLTPQSLAALAAACGYAAADAVDGVGQFARRGGIVDLFAPGAQEPVRIEFFGDEIESIAPFDLITQRRGESIPAFSLSPARELILTPQAKERILAAITAAQKRHKTKHPELFESLTAEAEAVRADAPTVAYDRYLSLIYEENAEAYVAQLNELDQEFQDVVDHSKRKLMIFGDRFPFRYFAEAYGLDYYAAFSGCASDTEPSAATMAFLINKVRDENIKTVLKMELSNENIAKAIAEATNADVKEFYSCHNLTAEQFADGETYLSLMEKNVETLREVLN